MSGRTGPASADWVESAPSSAEATDSAVRGPGGARKRTGPGEVTRAGAFWCLARWAVLERPLLPSTTGSRLGFRGGLNRSNHGQIRRLANRSDHGAYGVVSSRLTDGDSEM